MLVRHRGVTPSVHESAWVAPNAVVCGDVSLGPNARVMFGAVVNAEHGSIAIGTNSLVMENAVVRAGRGHPVTVGDCCLIGPHAHVTGATLHDGVFIATGASVFNGATVERGGEVRINAVVHVNSRVGVGVCVPIGWVAVGDPAALLPPNEHDAIWEVQKRLDFPGTVFGRERAPGETMMPDVMPGYCRSLGRHRDDEVSG